MKFECQPHGAHCGMEETDMDTINYKKRIICTLLEVYPKYHESAVREHPTNVHLS